MSTNKNLGQLLIDKAQELDPTYKTNNKNDFAEALSIVLNNMNTSSESEAPTPQMHCYQLISYVKDFSHEGHYYKWVNLNLYTTAELTSIEDLKTMESGIAATGQIWSGDTTEDFEYHYNVTKISPAHDQWNDVANGWFKFDYSGGFYSLVAVNDLPKEDEDLTTEEWQNYYLGPVRDGRLITLPNNIMPFGQGNDFIQITNLEELSVNESQYGDFPDPMYHYTTLTKIY